MTPKLTQTQKDAATVLCLLAIVGLSCCGIAYVQGLLRGGPSDWQIEATIRTIVKRECLKP